MGVIDWLSGGGQTEAGPAYQWDEEQMEQARGQQEAARREQDWLSEQYRRRIAGDAPSVAERQMVAQNVANKRQQLAMARSGTGGALGSAAAMGGAQRAAASMDADLARNAATLRAQEQMAAEQNLGALSGQMRAQDQGMFGAETDYQGMRANDLAGRDARRMQAEESWKQRRGSGVSGTMMAAGTAAAMMSDPDSKQDIRAIGTNQGNDNFMSALGASMQGFSRGSRGDMRIQQPQQQSSVTMSDVDAKSSVDDGAATQWLSSVRPVSFQYKDPDVNASSGAMSSSGQPGQPSKGDPRARRVGVLTSDLKRTPEGQSMVIDTPRGEAIDSARATGPLLAATAEQEGRIKALEALIQSGRDVDLTPETSTDPQLMGITQRFNQAYPDAAVRSADQRIAELDQRLQYRDQGPYQSDFDEAMARAMDIGEKDKLLMERRDLARQRALADIYRRKR
jgi:hypothetical protein